MITITHKIALFGIVLFAAVWILTPIALYKYKISSCVKAQSERGAESWNNTEIVAHSFCHQVVNGADGK
jgi:hypothetical protein